MIKLLHILKFTAVFSLLLLTTNAVAQQRVYVKTDGAAFTAIVDHADWEHATNDLQAAINALAPTAEGEEGGEIWIAGGSYFPTEIFEGDELNPRNKSFILKSGVSVIGGFAGTESTLEERVNYAFGEVNATVLDGNNGGVQAYHVVALSNVTDNTAVLQDVVVQNGLADEPNLVPDHENSTYFGGGIYARNGGHFINCYITNNNASLGGGVYCVSAIIEGCSFWGNNAIDIVDSDDHEGLGGALYVHEDASVTSCSFTNNHSDENGGAIYSSGSVFNDLTFSNNTASDYGGAVCTYANEVEGYDGGQYTNCVFENNSSGQSGGAVAALGGGLFDDCTFTSNQGRRGGGLYLQGSSVILMNSNVNSNRATISGSGVYNYGGQVENCIVESNEGTGVYLRGGSLSSSIIRDNYDTSQGGGVYSRGNSNIIDCYITNNQSTANGGGVFVFKDSEETQITTIVNTQINNNSAQVSGGGIYINGEVNVVNTSILRNKTITSLGEGVYCSAPTSPAEAGTFVNTIIWGNDGDLVTSNEIDYATDVTADFSYSAVEDILNLGEGNVQLSATDDVFIAPSSFIGVATSPEQEAEFETADWRLNLLSPCFNGGTPDITGLELPATDLLGNDRVYKDVIDMGAIENQYYDVAISSTGSGTISPASDVSVLPDANLVIILDPTEGNGISDVTINGTSVFESLVDEEDGTFSYTIATIQEDKVVNAAFLPYYTVSATAGEGGSISPASGQVLEGSDSEAFIITPDLGYRLTSLKLDDVDVVWDDTEGVLTYTVLNVTADASLVAGFTAYHTVSATAGVGGSISPASMEVLEGEDSDVFTITPDAGYQLTSLKLDDVDVVWDDTEGVLTYTVLNVTADASLVAGFTAYHTVTATAGVGGSISPASMEVLEGEDSDVFTITPDAGYQLTSLKLDDVDVVWDDTEGVLTYTVLNVTADASLVAGFTTYHTVTATAGVGGSISPASMEVLEGEDSDVFTITPDAGYQLTSLKLDDVDVVWDDTEGVLTYTVSNVTADASLVAGFTAYHTVTATAGDGGSVSPASEEVFENENHDLIISPDAGYKIVTLTLNGTSVLGDEVDNGNGTFTLSLLNVNEDIEIEVTFDLVNSVDYQSQADVKVYPTVTTGFLNVKGDYQTIEIVNLTGNVVKKFNYDIGNKLEVHDLRAGTYIVVIHSKDSRHLFKIIKK